MQCQSHCLKLNELLLKITSLFSSTWFLSLTRSGSGLKPWKKFFCWTTKDFCLLFRNWLYVKYHFILCEPFIFTLCYMWNILLFLEQVNWTFFNLHVFFFYALELYIHQWDNITEPYNNNVENKYLINQELIRLSSQCTIMLFENWNRKTVFWQLDMKN
jgi:hypothetical protein